MERQVDLRTESNTEQKHDVDLDGGTEHSDSASSLHHAVINSSVLHTQTDVEIPFRTVQPSVRETGLNSVFGEWGDDVFSEPSANQLSVSSGTFAHRMPSRLSNGRPPAPTQLQMPDEVSPHDRWTTLQLQKLHEDVIRLQIEMESALKAKSILEQHAVPAIQEHNDRFLQHQQEILRVQSQLEKARKALQTVADKAGLKDAIIEDEIHQHEEELQSAVAKHAAASEKLLTVKGEVAIQNAEAEVHVQQELIFARARDILRLRVEENFGKAPSLLLEEQITGLQAQLRSVARTQLASNQTSSWSLRSLWTTDKNAQALRSVQKLAKNPAFAQANLDRQTNAELKIDVALLTLMTHAMYALSTFNKLTAPEVTSSGAATSDDLDVGMSSVIKQTPPRVSVNMDAPLSQTRMTDASPARSSNLPTILQKSDIVNRAVIDVMRHDLAKIQKQAGGLIGSPNPNRQFWGRVLMVLALAIATTVAAVAVMTMLGVATPAFLVPYLAAIQASSMISTVLNFVAAKLTLDLNTAAAVTAVATAGAFGVFGKAVHSSGAPTQLKRDLDRAAQDLEAALKETPAALSMR